MRGGLGEVLTKGRNFVVSSRVNEGPASLDVCETASHGVMKTKKRLLFFSSECLEKL